MKISVFIDGTWNDPSDENQTNIFRLFKGVLFDDDHMGFYIPGVGNEQEGNFLTHWAGGAFGYGADDKKDEAIEMITDIYEDGDEVYVFGFSRGAAIARMVAAELPHVTFLGCFDTVGAFGLPLGFGQDINLFKDMAVGQNVANALHLVALDETRPAFVPTLMNRRDGITELWMTGAHSDVGGGNPHRGLSDLALHVMIISARQHGFDVEPGFLESLNPDKLGEIGYNTDDKLGAEPRLACIQAGDEFTKEKAVTHNSVFERMTAFSSYWPLAWLPT